MKKIISLVLVLVLVLGTFSFAFAAEVVAPSDVTDEDQIDAVEVLMGLGIVDGYTDGTYKPAKVVTRAEMAKLLIVELGYEDLTGGSAPFSDTAGHWGEGYIALAAGLGLVNGYPDGTFQPDNTVSFDEAITMVLRGLGYTDASLTGSWPTNYKIKAINIDLLDDVDVSGAGADRGNIAVMLYNALFLAYGDVDADDVWIENTDGTDSDNKATAKKVIDKVGKLVEEYQITYTDVYDDDDSLDTVIDLEPYLYHYVDYYENADEDVAYISDVYTDEIVLDHVALNSTSSSYVYEAQDTDDEDVYFDVSGASIVYNYATTNDATELFVDADLTVIYADTDDFDNDGDNAALDGDDDDDFDSSEIVAIIATMASAPIQVEDDVDADDEKISAKDATDIKLPLDEDGDFDASRLVVMGDVDAVEDIEENDVVEVYESKDYVYDNEDKDDLYIMVTRDTVEGKVTELDADDETATIDGVELDYVDYDSDKLGTSDLGTELIAYLNADGEIAFLEDSDDAVVSNDFAVVVGVNAGDTSADWTDIDVDDVPEIKIFTADGDVIVYDIDTSDFDFVSGATETVTLGDLVLRWTGGNTDAITIDNASNFERVLVQYDLNSDGEVDNVEFASELANEPSPDFDYATTGDYDEPVLAGGYIVEDTTVVFDITEADEDDWTVIDMDDIDLTSTATVNFVTEDDDNDVLAMTIAGNEDVTGVYALITNVSEVLDADDEEVEKLTGFIEGEAEYVLTDGSSESVFNTSWIDETIVEFEYDDAAVTAVTEVTATTEGAIDAISGDFVKVNGTYYELDSEVVVYEITYDDSDNSVDEVTLADADDLSTDGYVFFYDTDTDADDDEIDIVIYISEDEYEDAGHTAN